MKDEMASTEAELKSDSEKIRQMEEQRNSFNVGTKEYKDLDEELARNIANFKLKMDRLRKDFMDREAQLYYQTYLEVNEAIKYYAQHHDIAPGAPLQRRQGRPGTPRRRPAGDQ